jgi:hypothetical protein
MACSVGERRLPGTYRFALKRFSRAAPAMSESAGWSMRRSAVIA